MAFELGNPWFLIAVPAALAAVLLIYRALPARSTSGRFALASRCAITLMLSLALAAPSIVTGSRVNATWVLIDGSDSAAAALTDIRPALSDAFDEAPEDLETGVIAFGQEASVEAPLSTEHRFSSGNVRGDDSRLSSALELAAALMPSDVGGRVAVVSDGLTDDVTAAAALLAGRSLPVDVLTLAREPVPDAQVSALTLPSTLRAGQSLAIDVTIDSTVDGAGTLVLYADRAPIATREVTLRRGSNAFTFRHDVQTAGVVTYEARLTMDGDARAQNNRRSAFVRALGAARVLLVEGRTGDARELQKMLAAAGFAVDLASPTQMGGTPESLRTYDAIALVNVDARTLTSAQLAALDTAVRTFGRGLAAFGGDASYALGNYRGTALEQMLPVTMDVKETLDMPSLALMLVIDKSSSMDGGGYGISLMEMAKEAAIRACAVLTERDEVGVIAFDSDAKWVAGLEPYTDPGKVEASIGSIRASGGTAYTAALTNAFGALMESDAPQRHIIFLSDGEPGDGGFEGLIAAYEAEGITLTTVGVGSGANAPLLSRMAHAGNGRVYMATEFDDLPSLFAKETQIAAGKYVQNRTFTPSVAEHSTLTNFPGFPVLDGYLATTIKPLATAAMLSDEDDPILAHWRYGAGTTLAWTSDASGAWTEHFLSWDQAAEFFSGLIGYVLPTTEQAGTMTAEIEHGQLRVRYEQPAEAEDAALATRMQVLGPDGSDWAVELSETAPGVYEGAVPADDQGAYAVTVRQSSGEDVVRTLDGGAVNSFSGEYDLTLLSGEPTLERLASATGGRVLTDASELFAERGSPSRARTDLAPWLIGAALLLFLVDVTLRRLNLPRSRAPKPEKPADKKPPPRPSAKRDRNAKAADEPEDTAEKLLDARRRRKLM